MQFVGRPIFRMKHGLAAAPQLLLIEASTAEAHVMAKPSARAVVESSDRRSRLLLVPSDFDEQTHPSRGMRRACDRLCVRSSPRIVSANLTRPRQYGDSTMDGVVLMLSASEDRTRRAITQALRATGFAAARSSPTTRVLETAFHSVATDTTMRVRVTITPPEQAGGRTVVVFTGRYSVATRGIRNAWIIQRPGESNPLYQRLSAIADSTRQFIAASP